MKLVERIKGFFQRGTDSSVAAVSPASSTLRQESADVMAWLDFVEPDFPIEIIALIERLVMWIPDLSQTVKRIIALGNTGLTWAVEGADEQTLKKILNDEIPEFFEQHPGITNALMRQTIISGALSAEAVPTLDLSGIETIQMIKTASVRFKKVKLETDRSIYVPYQELPDGKHLLLNSEQYTYDAIERNESSPYAIPPFIAAIPSIFVQLEGREGLRGLLDRNRLLGFLHLAKEPPRRRPGTTDGEHDMRVRAILKDIRDAFVKSRKEGLVVSTSDVKADFHSFSSDSRGFEHPWRANEEQIASGLDMPPSLLGRSYSTTETYAGVDYTAFVNKLGNARHPAKRFLQKTLNLHCRLRGYKFKRIRANWNPDAALQPDRDAAAAKSREEAMEARLRWLTSLRELGIIDDEKVASEMGFELAKPARAKLQSNGGRVLNLSGYQKKSPKQGVHVVAARQALHGS